MMQAERLAGLGRLAAGLAHEINNPLEGMGNFLDLADEDIREGRADDAMRMVGRARAGIDSLADLTGRLLDLASPERRVRRPLDLRDPLRRAAELAEARRVSGTPSIDLALGSTEVTVEGDPNGLQQLFLNLLLNAVELQPDGGEIRASCSAAGASARVTVDDRGPGLTDEAARRLFEPFFSTRGSTGLGLAICHAIVHDHGGSITAANRDGGGARIRVELPLASPPVIPPSEESERR